VIIIFEIIFEMCKDDHTIRNVFEIVQKQSFHKITHIPIPRNFPTLELVISDYNLGEYVGEALGGY
jgi:hypothetical protein